MQQNEADDDTGVNGFQSMHPIKDATMKTKGYHNKLIISIHAPYKGCNRSDCSKRWSTCISIHAPYKGCNPFGKLSSLSHLISIHAPYKGCNAR